MEIELGMCVDVCECTYVCVCVCMYVWMCVCVPVLCGHAQRCPTPGSAAKGILIMAKTYNHNYWYSHLCKDIC